MTVPDLLMLVKAAVFEHDTAVARKALADLYEEHGETETARVLRGEWWEMRYFDYEGELDYDEAFPDRETALKEATEFIISDRDMEKKEGETNEQFVERFNVPGSRWNKERIEIRPWVPRWR